MVVVTVVTDQNPHTIKFRYPVKAREILLLSCSLYNSWHNLPHNDTIKLFRGRFPNVTDVPAGHYTIESLAEVFKNYLKGYDGGDAWVLGVETYTPRAAIEMKKTYMTTITLGPHLTGLLGLLDSNLIYNQNGNDKTLVKWLSSPSTYFIHCNRMDPWGNFYNGMPTTILGQFDIRGKPYEKVSYSNDSSRFNTAILTPEKDEITLSVRDKDGELFDFKGTPLRFEIEMI